MSSVTPASAQAAPARPYSGHEKRTRIFAIVAASSGNLVEWFDFYVYAFARDLLRAGVLPEVATPPRSC